MDNNKEESQRSLCYNPDTTQLDFKVYFVFLYPKYKQWAPPKAALAADS